LLKANSFILSYHVLVSLNLIRAPSRGFFALTSALASAVPALVVALAVHLARLGIGLGVLL
jgi:hypothetical protein